MISVAQEFPQSLAAIRPCIPESGAAVKSYLELREGGRCSALSAALRLGWRLFRS